MFHSDDEPIDYMDLWHRQKELEMELEAEREENEKISD